MSWGKNIICALVLFAFACPASASFIQVSAAIYSPEVVSEGTFYINVTLTNNGDETAHDVIVSIEAPAGFEAREESVGSLEPNVPTDVSLPVFLNGSKLPGTYPLMLKIRYSDANAYHFSTVTPVFIRFREAAPDRLDGSIGSVRLTSAGESEMTLSLSNLDSAPHKVQVRFILPDELKTSYPAIQENVAGLGVIRIPVVLRSEGALAGSTYPVYALAEFDDGGLHYGSAMSGTVSIVAESEKEMPRWLPTAVIVVLVVSIAYYQVRG